MTSIEADTFMLNHPEVAVKPIGGEDGTWVAWNTTLKHRVGRLWVEVNEQGIGFSRESAIANYRDHYHPVKTTGGDMIKILRRDAQKYYEILKFVDSFPEGRSGFMAGLMDIIRDDITFKPRCRDECGQEIKP